MVNDFDLKDAERTFDFVFQLYNFVSLANEDNITLHKPFDQLVKLDLHIKGLQFPSLTGVSNRKRKTRDDGDAGTGSPKKGRREGGPVESDIFSDVAILEAVESAGYTIPPEVENFKSLLPVRVSFPRKGQRLTLPLS